MFEVVSRRQKREADFYKAAEKGLFSIDCYLYKSEVRTLAKKGFNVISSFDSKYAVPCKVSWENAFNNTVPLIVADFIIGVIRTFPRNLNWAQELFVIAKVS